MAAVTCIRCGHVSDIEHLLDPTRSDLAVHLDGSICMALPPTQIEPMDISDEEWEAWRKALDLPGG